VNRTALLARAVVRSTPADQLPPDGLGRAIRAQHPRPEQGLLADLARRFGAWDGRRRHPAARAFVANRAAAYQGALDAERARPFLGPMPLSVAGLHVMDTIGGSDVGIVYLCREAGSSPRRSAPSWVAVKRYHAHLSEDASFAEAVRTGARAAMRARHPGLVHVQRWGEDAGVPFRVMEHLRGEILATLVDPDQGGARLPSAIALRIVSDAADALHAVHEARDEDGRPLSLAHGAVSPLTLFVTYDGRTKVLGLGERMLPGFVMHTRFSGTSPTELAYTPPERVRGAADDRRGDVYRLGLLLYELTTGACPYPQRPDLAILEAVLAGGPPRPSAIVAGYPEALEAVVLRASARRPEDRYPTARALADELQDLLAREGRSVGPAEIEAFLAPRLGSRRQEREARIADLLTCAREPPTSAPAWLLARLAEGDSGVFEGLFQAEAPRLLAHARRWLDQASADEAVRDAFVALRDDAAQSAEHRSVWPHGFLFATLRHALVRAMASRTASDEGPPAPAGGFEALLREDGDDVARLAAEVCDPLEQEAVTLALGGADDAAVAAVLGIPTRRAGAARSRAVRKILAGFGESGSGQLERVCGYL
jgi:serine/threonine-protein kinase